MESTIILPTTPDQRTADIAQQLLGDHFGELRNRVSYHITKDQCRCSGTFENISLHCEASTQEDAYYNLCDGLIRIFSNKPIKPERIKQECHKQKWEPSPELAKLTQSPCTR